MSCVVCYRQKCDGSCFKSKFWRVFPWSVNIYCTLSFLLSPAPVLWETNSAVPVSLSLFFPFLTPFSLLSPTLSTCVSGSILCIPDILQVSMDHIHPVCMCLSASLAFFFLLAYFLFFFKHYGDLPYFNKLMNLSSVICLSTSSLWLQRNVFFQVKPQRLRHSLTVRRVWGCGRLSWATVWISLCVSTCLWGCFISPSSSWTHLDLCRLALFSHNSWNEQETSAHLWYMLQYGSNTHLG